ncbi:MAG: DUF2309 domain-containing protein [Methylomicrobium sp.]|nr:DUF2309 domain-containing protein [Methylomicrobium sp.]
MQQSTLNHSEDIGALREQLMAVLHHLDHVLPGQAPIGNFVHHNTLHGFQHLPFEQALAEFEALTGISGYLPEIQFRAFYQQGRINDNDILAALSHETRLDPRQVIIKVDTKTISISEIVNTVLLHGLEPVSPERFNWLQTECAALNSLRPGVSQQAREQLVADEDEAVAINKLWNTLLDKLGINDVRLHPENLFDISAEQAEDWLARSKMQPTAIQNLTVVQQIQEQARNTLDALVEEIGDNITLRGFVLALTGMDILDDVRPLLIRTCASALDEGLAPWQLPDVKRLGLYAAWRLTARYDANPFFQELPDWPILESQLPDDAVDAIVFQLTALQVPQQHWPGYLRRLALELPGWSGIINWREHNPNYKTANGAQPTLADYLAIRLTLDRLWLNRLCEGTWKIEAKLGRLISYFQKNLAEFWVRRQLYRGVLPEYLSQSAESLILLSRTERQDRKDWWRLAEELWTWQSSPLTHQHKSKEHTFYDSGWRLFCLCQHSGLNARHVQSLNKADLENLLMVLDSFGVADRNKVWLYAYEHNFRENLFQGLQANYGRGRWATRPRRPDAQVMFCMDEREESFRRHLEEINPAIETLGAAGFFGVAMNYRGLDDHAITPLCPVVVTPVHQVNEIPVPGAESAMDAHQKGLGRYKKVINLVHQSLRSQLFAAYPLLYVFAPLLIVKLVIKSLLPTTNYKLEKWLYSSIVKTVPTELQFTSIPQSAESASDAPQFGFTDQEQADRIAQLLKTTGLSYGMARIVCLMAHGSTSQNNPHEAAHDCGACGGRRGGPNARVFAAMANRPEVRRLLPERGITIPEDTWFVGAQHDTCNDIITWYDLERMPVAVKADFETLDLQLMKAKERAVTERCRRFFNAQNKSGAAAVRHVEARSYDLSQVRPEFGHATNASAYIGRRSATQGLFLDRRMFLISYDPAQDPDGTVLESILLTAGPVGAGINLEYYFSSVNNERFGCGTKIPHNVTGLFGVMEGAASDLRTGLPLQMVEIHEAMRLQIVTEASPGILEKIYHRQAGLRELIDGGWVHLSTQDPDTGQLFIFERGAGFVAWESAIQKLPLRESSEDCYRTETEAVPPMLIKQPLISNGV